MKKIRWTVSSYAPEIESLHGFVSHHDVSLVQYNTSVREGRDFRGMLHPAITASSVQFANRVNDFNGGCFSLNPAD